MKRTSGFTVIELIVVIVFVGVATTLLLVQKNNLQATQRDNTRKTAVNAMYYNLEEVFYEKNKFYPATIDSKNLRAMDPNLFTDPYGAKLGDEESSYHYEGTNCVNEQCKSYKLTADMEKEAEYTKKNRNN